MAQHRNTINLHISATTYPEVQQCLADTSHRVLLFCAGEAIGSQNIEFPHQAEIRVNGSEVKANLRGLKSKPGSTRPVDITDALRIKPPNYLNTIDFTYALTTKVRTVGVSLWLLSLIGSEILHDSKPLPGILCCGIGTGHIHRETNPERLRNYGT